jgi:hypothetical protein
MPQDFVAENPYLDSLMYEAASLYTTGQPRRHSENITTSGMASLRPAKYESLYLKPFHAAQVIEPRLSDARPSLWTTICDDDVLMRDILAVFFRCEYHFTAAFQKDYFLEDMAAQRGDFCSSLLVNVTLAYSCVQYFHIFQKVAPLIRYYLGLLPPVRESCRVLEPQHAHVSLPCRGQADLGT